MNAAALGRDAAGAPADLAPAPLEVYMMNYKFAVGLQPRIVLNLAALAAHFVEIERKQPLAPPLVGPAAAAQPLAATPPAAPVPPFLVTEALYRKTDISRGPSVDGRDFDEGVFQLHFLY